MKNLFGKSRTVDNPYAIYRLGNFEWRVLKTYQRKDKEDANQYARWFTACKSPMTYDSWEYGDVYINEIKDVGAKLIDSTPSWKEVYQV